jgi:hypothetical protein
MALLSIHYIKKGERGQAHHKPAPISLYGRYDPTPSLAQRKSYLDDKKQTYQSWWLGHQQ